MRAVTPISKVLNRVMIITLVCGFSFSLLAQQPGRIKANHVNIRSKATVESEVITQLNYGDPVVIIEDLEKNNASPSDPDLWLKIKMPNQIPVWVSANYVDANTKKVTATRLNVRSGPGENHAVVDRIERDTPVDILKEEAGWLQIATTQGAWAFVAASLVEPINKDTNPPAKPAVEKTEPPIAQKKPILQPIPPPPSNESQASNPSQPTNEPKGQGSDIFTEMMPMENTASKPAEVIRSTDISAQDPNPSRRNPNSRTAEETRFVGSPGPSNQANTNQQSTSGPVFEPVTTNETPPTQVSAPERLPVNTTPQKPGGRLVVREGKIGSAKSPLAPGGYTLKSLYNGRVINYLYNEEGKLDLTNVRGYPVRVEGFESVDPRWPETPVIEIEKLILID